MEIKQLAFVLEKINEFFGEGQMLSATDQLIAVLEQTVAGNDTADQLNDHRQQLYSLHTAVELKELTSWTDGQLQLFDKYGGRHLLGQSVIDQINKSFVDNLMHPAAVLATVQSIRNQSAALHGRAQLLLTDLDPVLFDEEEKIDGLIEAEYDIINNNPVYINDHGQRVVERLRHHFLATKTVQTPTDHIPIRAKAIAAMPVALAVAGKAIDLYIRHKQTKSESPRSVNQPQNSRPSRFLYYRRTITITERED